MEKLYFIYFIIDLVWKTASIVYILYKYTTFFTMIYNIIKFSIKIGNNILFIQKSIFNFTKTSFINIYNKLLKKDTNYYTYSYSPLYETTNVMLDDFDDMLHSNFSFRTSESESKSENENESVKKNMYSSSVFLDINI